MRWTRRHGVGKLSIIHATLDDKKTRGKEREEKAYVACQCSRNPHELENQDRVHVHCKNKLCSEGPYRFLHVVPNSGLYLVLQGTPIEGASKDPHAMVL